MGSWKLVSSDRYRFRDVPSDLAFSATLKSGEPFLHEKADWTLTRLAERFSNRGFLVYTNGTLIDGDVASRLGRVGNIFPAISVEGFEHQTDVRRGRGIYEQNRRVRRLLAEPSVMTGFSAAITSAKATTDHMVRRGGRQSSHVEARAVRLDSQGWTNHGARGTIGR